MTFEAYSDKSKLTWLAIIAGVFIAFGIWAISRSDVFLLTGASRKITVLADFFSLEVPTMARIMGATSILLGGLVSLPIFSAFRTSGPALSINQNGIFYARRADDIIEWSNIESATRFEFGNAKLLKMILVDPSKNIARIRTGPMKAVGFLFSKKQVVLTLQGTKGDFDKMMTVFNHYYK